MNSNLNIYVTFFFAMLSVVLMFKVLVNRERDNSLKTAIGKHRGMGRGGITHYSVIRSVHNGYMREGNSFRGEPRMGLSGWPSGIVSDHSGYMRSGT